MRNATRVAKTTAARAAAVFLLLAAGTWLTTRVIVSGIDRDFSARSSRHLGREVQHVHDEIADTESALDAAVSRVAKKIAAKPAATRDAMFAMLHGEANGVRQGIRIVAPNGEALAWWGED